MKIVARFSGKHDDFIHDLKYDWYGQRLATCSSDQLLKIWDKVGTNWVCNWSWKVHTGSVWKIDWAHPEFGQIIATCSFDRSIIIWEEPADKEQSLMGEDVGWDKKASLADSRESVQDIKFSPRHMGLKLATCSLDGNVRIFEAVDTMNLNSWPLVEEFEACKDGVNCIAWNQSRFDPPMLVVGCNDNAGTVKVWGYDDSFRRWQPIETLAGPSPLTSAHQGPIHDVAWAPSMGRSYHLIATASKDQFVKIWELRRDSTKQGNKYVAKLVAAFDHHKAEVWKVEWNVTGTVLASSGDDGTIRLWKRNLNGKWRCAAVMRGGESASSSDDLASMAMVDDDGSVNINNNDLASFGSKFTSNNNAFGGGFRRVSSEEMADQDRQYHAMPTTTTSSSSASSSSVQHFFGATPSSNSSSSSGGGMVNSASMSNLSSAAASSSSSSGGQQAGAGAGAGQGAVSNGGAAVVGDGASNGNNNAGGGKSQED